MISAKRLVLMAKKWQQTAALTRKRLTFSTPMEESKGSCCTSAPVAGKGHCVLYSADCRRFEVPLSYLNTPIFGKLLMLSQEEFGFAGEDGRIMLPCDAMAMEYVMCLLRRGASVEVERAFLSSMAGPCHYRNDLAQSMGAGKQSAVPTF